MADNEQVEDVQEGEDVQDEAQEQEEQAPSVDFDALMQRMDKIEELITGLAESKNSKSPAKKTPSPKQPRKNSPEPDDAQIMRMVKESNERIAGWKSRKVS